MQALKNKWFIAAVVLFVLNQLAEYFHYYLPIIHSYLDDLLFIPIILTPALTIMRMLLGNSYKLSVWRICWTVLYAALIMEVVLPYYSAHFIRDFVDVVMYGSGAILFHLLINKTSQQKPLSRSVAPDEVTAYSMSVL